MTRFILILFFLVFATGCATSPALDQYPRRQIERPYTLPKGVAAYKPTVAFQYARDFNDTRNFWFLNPLNFQQALSDDLNLVWDPLPLGMLWQIKKTDTEMWGAGARLYFDYASSAGVRMGPDLFSTYRHTFDTASKWLGTEVRARVTPIIPLRSSTAFSWQAGMDIGPFIQATDTFAIIPRVGIFVERDYFSDLPGGRSFDTGSIRPVMPLSLKLSWNVCRRWDLEPEYSFRNVGYERNFRSHDFLFTAIYRW